MVIPALRSILDDIGTWPEERQERAAALLRRVEVSDDLTISDEDAAEIEAMLRNPDEPTMSLEEFRIAMAEYLE